VVSPAVKG